MALYHDPDTQAAIATHSMIKTFRRCPKQAQFKYALRLKPRLSKPLRRGTWFHKLLEVHHGGGDWRDAHQKLTTQFMQLWDEEREEMGDLPNECAHMMRSYLWHYRDDPWKVLQTEFTLECPFPDGTIYRGKIDLLVENQFGLWIVDHKTHKSLPGFDYRLLDSQSALYIWAAWQNGIKVNGHIWNYVRWKMPTIPALVYQKTDNPRLTSRAVDTDYPTYLGAIKAYGLDTAPYADKLRRLKSQRYRPGEAQTSAFFRRDVLEKSKGLIKNVVNEAYLTATKMNNYDFNGKYVERVPDRSCFYMCSFSDVCTADLLGGNIRPLLKNYKVGDPMDYYYDDDGAEERKSDR